MAQLLRLNNRYLKREPQSRINIDLPLWIVEALDQEAVRISVPRQAVFQARCHRLRQIFHQKSLSRILSKVTMAFSL